MNNILELHPYSTTIWKTTDCLSEDKSMMIVYDDSINFNFDFKVKVSEPRGKINLYLLPEELKTKSTTHEFYQFVDTLTDGMVSLYCSIVPYGRNVTFFWVEEPSKDIPISLHVREKFVAQLSTKKE